MVPTKKKIKKKKKKTNNIVIIGVHIRFRLPLF
jgi:hypothetical protein